MPTPRRCVNEQSPNFVHLLILSSGSWMDERPLDASEFGDRSLTRKRRKTLRCATFLRLRVAPSVETCNSKTCASGLNKPG